MNRRWWRAAPVVVLAVCFSSVAVAQDEKAPTTKAATVGQAEKLIGLEFTPAERDSMRGDLDYYLELYELLRGVAIPNQVPPSLVFNPLPVGFDPSGEEEPVRLTPVDARMPENPDDLAFYDVRTLGELIRTKQVTSVALTEFFLSRLKTHGPELECVITITEDLALRQARRADEEIAAGTYRGPLHGIPYGAKDLLAVEGYPTTWGAMPYKERMIDDTATVVRKLEDAGAVLVAKLTMGALAWGDVWYGGMTRNPWNLEQGSSGSSAGSAAATAAGLVPFAIGTETWGSIVSPSTRCGTTGLRPTFGRVSRAGAMALSWSMDKIGPICRSAEDCAIVFDAIRGSDGLDESVIDAPFNYDHDVDLSTLRIGYVNAMMHESYPDSATNVAVMDALRDLGANLVEIELPDLPIDAMSIILSAEAAAAFDELTRSNQDTLLVRQIKNAWPNTFRAARFIPAVEYIQANRLRWMAIQQMQKLDVDVYVTPSFGGDNLLLTNLTGHPCVVMPSGFSEEGTPVSVTFMGRLFGEADLLAVANAWQRATDFHTRHPERYVGTGEEVPGDGR